MRMRLKDSNVASKYLFTSAGSTHVAIINERQPYCLGPCERRKKVATRSFLILEAPAHLREHSKHFSGSILAQIQPHFLFGGVVLQV